MIPRRERHTFLFSLLHSIKYTGSILKLIFDAIWWLIEASVLTELDHRSLWRRGWSFLSQLSLVHKTGVLHLKGCLLRHWRHKLNCFTMSQRWDKFMLLNMLQLDAILQFSPQILQLTTEVNWEDADEVGLSSILRWTLTASFLLLVDCCGCFGANQFALGITLQASVVRPFNRECAQIAVSGCRSHVDCPIHF